MLPRPARTRASALGRLWPPSPAALLLLPAVLIFIVFLVIPLMGMAWSSLFVYDRRIGETLPGLTFANYERFLADSRNLDIFVRTFKLALVATVISLMVGYPLAYYISKQRGQIQTYLLFLIAMPLLVLVVVRTFGWLIILASNGVVNSALTAVGLIDAPIRLIHTEVAIVVGLVHVFLPFMVLAIFTALQNIDPTLLRAAQSLGASRATTFVRVTLPLSLPGIAAGSLLVFTLSASAFATPAMLGGSRAPVLTYSVYQEIFSLVNWPLASAVSMLLLLAVSAAVLLYLRLIENRRYKVVFG